MISTQNFKQTIKLRTYAFWLVFENFVVILENEINNVSYTVWISARYHRDTCD